MVNGLQKNGAVRDLLAVDLDGTLLRTNSFTRFTVWFACTLLKRRMHGGFFRVVHQVVLRKIRRQSHTQTKRNIMDIAAQLLSEDDFVAFARSLRRWVCNSVECLIRSHMASGGEVVIATAAPVEYAAPLAAMAGGYSLLASERGISGVYHECKGEEKLRRVSDFCVAHNLQLASVVTDHYDDLPLIKAADNVYLASPSKETLRKIRQEEGISSCLTLL